MAGSRDPRRRPERELKWVLPAARAALVAGFLASRLRLDRAYAAGWVVSLYYDTPDWRFLQDKLNSDYLKTKLRLRWYEDDRRCPLGKDAFLEVKGKIGSSRTKLRLPSPLPATLLGDLPLTDSRLRALPDLARAAGAVLPAPLQPVFIVRYRRRRFVDPLSGLRVSLDDRVHVPAVNPLRVPGFRSARLSVAVVEVKGPDAQLPRTLRPLRGLGCRLQALSKYAACHALITDSAPCP
jgi:VTC domain